MELEIEEKKSEQTKEVLELEHTTIIDNGEYEYPPVDLLTKENELNVTDAKVFIGDLLKTDKFKNNKSKTTLALGKDSEGSIIITDFDEVKNLVIIDNTCSEQMVCIDTIIASILYKAKPSEVKMLMIDPEDIELSIYNELPYLEIPVVVETNKAVGALAWLVQEMNYRYNIFMKERKRTLQQYNETVEENSRLPEIIVIINNLSRLIVADEDNVKFSINELVQKSSKVGIHLIFIKRGYSNDKIVNQEIENNLSKIVIGNFEQGEKDNKDKIETNMSLSLLGNPKEVFFSSAYISYKQVEDLVNFMKK